MHFHLPKLVHGWREFFGEVGIVVFGVLVALGAEQLVKVAYWRDEVRTFREAVDHELGCNIGIYAKVMAQRPCVDKNIADMERFRQDGAEVQRDQLLRPIGQPIYASQCLSVWDNKGRDISQHLPMAAGISYSEREFHVAIGTIV